MWWGYKYFNKLYIIFQLNYLTCLKCVWDVVINLSRQKSKMENIVYWRKGVYASGIYLGTQNKYRLISYY